MRCIECGGQGTAGCAELFDRLLALDHSRQPPWGPLHSVAVACYRLQHESALPLVDRTHMLALAHAYVDGGELSLRALTDRITRANSHRARTAGRPMLPEFADFVALAEVAAPRVFAYTIADVALDGGFPADGYAERIRAWAEAALAAWQQPST